MASVVIDTLKIVDNKNKFIYKDLNLDLKLDYILEPTVNSKKTIRDITAAEDI